MGTNESGAALGFRGPKYRAHPIRFNMPWPTGFPAACHPAAARVFQRGHTGRRAADRRRGQAGFRRIERTRNKSGYADWRADPGAGAGRTECKTLHGSSREGFLQARCARKLSPLLTSCIVARCWGVSRGIFLFRPAGLIFLPSPQTRNPAGVSEAVARELTRSYDFFRCRKIPATVKPDPKSTRDAGRGT